MTCSNPLSGLLYCSQVTAEISEISDKACSPPAGYNYTARSHASNLIGKNIADQG